MGTVEDLYRRRDPERRERILGLIREIWAIDWDARLFQLLINSLNTKIAPETTTELYNFEDDDLEPRLVDLLERLQNG